MPLHTHSRKRNPLNLPPRGESENAHNHTNCCAAASTPDDIDKFAFHTGSLRIAGWLMAAIKIKTSLFSLRACCHFSRLLPMVFSSLFPDVKHCAMTAAALGATMTKNSKGSPGCSRRFFLDSSLHFSATKLCHHEFLHKFCFSANIFES